MTRRCPACGSWKSSRDEDCWTCRQRSRRDNAGSAPELKRRGPAVGSKALGQSSRRTPAAETRLHPSSARFIDYPCFAHNQRSALNCARCIENGERDWEEREDLA